MRYFFNILLLILLVGCTKNTSDIPIDINIQLKQGEYYQIEKKSSKYLSSDDYVASVTDYGMIQANYVGKAIISTENNDKINIDVTPEYNLYEDPSYLLGKTISEIETILKQKARETYDYYIFDYTGLDMIFVSLTTGGNTANLLRCSIPYEDKSLIYNHLSERYRKLNISDNNYIYFTNTLSNDNNEFILIIKLHKSYSWVYYYINYIDNL